MDKETLIENEFIYMWYYPKQKIVHHRVRKYVYGDVWRDALQIGLDKLIATNSTKWLSDDRNASASPKEDVDWAKEIWTPKAIEGGLRHWAIAIPTKVTGRMFHKRMVKNLDESPINIKIFDDPDQAMEWLSKI